MRSIFLPVLCLLVAGTVEAQTPTPSPGPIREEVVVTAARVVTPLADTPASVMVVSRREIEITAAPTMDDVLRQSVGFSIFRRSSSRNANPTSQGVSLRGVGSSGASRTVVLFDGVPLNDPFGGWVQWNRVSPIEAERIEVLRGGASSLYGDTSLSGAVEVVPRTAGDKWTVSADLSGGTQRTLSGSAYVGIKYRSWSGSVAASKFQTRGYVPIDKAVRGPVDVYAGVRSSNYAGRFGREIGQHASVFFRPSYFGEVRTNGTGMQTNRTHIRQLIIGGNVTRPARSVDIRWRAFGGRQVYDQIFSAINSTRTAESLTRIQRVPAQNIGGTIQASAVFGPHTLVAGIEARNVRGASDEIGVGNGLPTAASSAGGRETTAGGFVRDFMRIGERLVLTAGARYDRWRNFAASAVNRNLGNNLTTITNFPDRAESAWSPQIAGLYHASDALSFYANASRSFRAPTLNELYRGFRVGNVLTLANEGLRAERADNVEAGVRYGLKSLTLRTNVFWTRIDRPVANVTLMSTPNLITRQRQNAGSTRSRGIEIEAEFRIRKISVSAGYLYADPRVTEFPANPQLVGLVIPQVPRNQFTFQANWTAGRWTLSTQARASGEQFDDDLNEFRLEPYFQMDLFAARRFKEKLQIYAAVENVFNSRYSVGKTPVRTVSSPISLRLGLRWN